MKKIVSLVLIIGFCFTTNAQTEEVLKKELDSKKKEIAKLDNEAKAIQAKINGIPGWKYGAFGTIGGNLSGSNNWYSKVAPNSSTGNIGITVNAYANLMQDDFFWKNSAAVNLGWVKNNIGSSNEDNGFDTTTDIFTISSLYGKKLSEKWALSGMGEYRTTIIENFNNPGYLDLGVGFTWTPLSNLVVVIHPGNYNFVFSDGDSVFESSLGAKIVADYTASYKNVSLKSNLSMFQSYKSADFSNWTWTNSLGYKLWKGIGIGFELGLRSNKQETLTNAISQNDLLTTPLTTPNFKTVDNKLQSYWLFGINYNF